MDEKQKGKLHKALGAGIGWIMGGPVGALPLVYWWGTYIA